MGKRRAYTQQTELLGGDHANQPVDFVSMVDEIQSVLMFQMFDVFWINVNRDVRIGPPGVQKSQFYSKEL